MCPMHGVKGQNIENHTSGTLPIREGGERSFSLFQIKREGAVMHDIRNFIVETTSSKISEV